ncbi:uncharacterized protein LOC116307656, partial [Actinia tenebrosa]|uniref:Uncharacterized protein LOC116307656 n=1 Tax=Actinia tenebrosa TaxID=6105 RepID=A0A6P8J2K8_ACTTE
MVGYHRRVAALLCLLLVLHEFGPAHFAHVKPPSDSTLDEVDQNPRTKEQEQEAEKDKPVEDEKKHEGQKKHHGNKEHEGKEHQKEHGQANKRGFGSVVKNIIKVAKVGNEIIPKMVVLASIGNTIFRAIAGCCADYPKACEGNEEISELRTNISSKSEELDRIQSEAKDLQEWIESTSDEFATVLFKLNSIVDNADTLVRSLSPAVQQAIERQTTEIKKLVRKNKESGKEIDFIEVQEMYDSAIKIALGIALPVITVVIPTIPKLVKFAETKMGLRNSYTLDDSLSNALKKPPATSSKAKVLKSWLGKTKVRIDDKLESFRTTLNTKYGGAVKVMQNIGSGLVLILGYVGS